MQIRICDFEELPNWVDKEELSNSGSGMENASYLTIEDGSYKKCYSDAMEPEDAMFFRGLRWVKVELERAYNADI